MRKTKDYQPITVTRVFKSEYDNINTETAELKQEVIITTYYPKTKIKNSLQDNIFTESDFKTEETSYERIEIRQAWLTVPKGTSVTEMEFKLLDHKKARIYKILSNYPIVTKEEEDMLTQESPLITRDILAERQVVRHGDSSDTPHELILDKYGKLQYRRLCFSLKPLPDKDLRNNTANDMYKTDRLEAELNGENILNSVKY